MENSRTMLKLFVTTVHKNKYLMDLHLLCFACLFVFFNCTRLSSNFRVKVEIIQDSKFLRGAQKIVVNKRDDKLFHWSDRASNVHVATIRR